MDIQQFLKRFEKDIIEKGVIEGVFNKTAIVPTSQGKLANSPFAKLVGHIVESPQVFGISYYEHIKKSKGFFEHAFNNPDGYGLFPSSIEVILVSFSSIKDKHFHLLAPNDPQFLGEFFTVKQAMIKTRWGI